MESEIKKQMQVKFLMFENDKNVCWLDASIALVAHNKTFKKIVENSSDSEINKIISAYDEATNTFNNSDPEQKMSKTQKILLAIQSSTLKYLKQFLKFKPGEPDSAFCALLNLIYQDKSKIKEYLNVSWIWRKQCSNCGVNSKSATCLKPIITLSKVDSFHPECPSSIYVCSCKSEQEMKLIYKELPPCLIFHFEKGVGTGTNFPLNFSMKGRKYELTSFVILEKSGDPNLNHFITWIRNPVFNVWLECNDLNTGFATFTQIKPEYDLKDLYIAVFEAFDNLDRINNDDDDELFIDEGQDVENFNVELIDLSDEEGGSENADAEENSCNISNQNVSVGELNFTSEVPLDENKIETKSKDLDSDSHHAIDNFIKSTEFKAEIADYKDNKVRKDTIESKDESFSNPLVNSETHSVGENITVNDTSYKETGKDVTFSNPLVNSETHSVGENITVNDTSSEETGKISPQNSSILDTVLEDKVIARENDVNRDDENKLQLKKQIFLKTKENKSINLNEEKVEDKYISSSEEKKERTDRKYVSSGKEKNVVNINDQHAVTLLERNEISENICQSSQYTFLPAEVINNQMHNVTYASSKNNKEENSNVLNYASVGENLTIDDASCKKPFFGKVSSQNSFISDAVLEDKANVKENKLNSYDEGIHVKMQSMSIKIEENKCSNPNEEKAVKVKDKCINSSKEKKERTDYKYTSLGKEKNIDMNDQCAGTSFNRNEISGNMCQSSKSTATSKDFGCHKKKSKVLNSEDDDFEKQREQMREKEFNRNALSEVEREEIRRIVDFNVTRTYAAFFQSINQARQDKSPH